MDVMALAQQCTGLIQPETMQAIVKVESRSNPYAIGVVHGRLERQPRNLAEAIATAQALERDGWNFSLGITQVNRHNLEKYKLDYQAAFDPCSNIRAGADILKDCFDRARPRATTSESAWRMAYSCYYSGNFKTGFIRDFKGQPSYVNKVLASMGKRTSAIRVTSNNQPNRFSQTAHIKSPAAMRESIGDAWAMFGAKEI